jgi:hypothetical protein
VVRSGSQPPGKRILFNGIKKLAVQVVLSELISVDFPVKQGKYREYGTGA